MLEFGPLESPQNLGKIKPAMNIIMFFCPIDEWPSFLPKFELFPAGCASDFVNSKSE